MDIMFPHHLCDFHATRKRRSSRAGRKCHHRSRGGKRKVATQVLATSHRGIILFPCQVKCQSTLVENLSIMYLNWAVKWGLDEEVIHNLFNDCALTSEFYREPLLM